VLAMTDFLQSKVQVLYDGLAGDVLSGGLFLTAHRLRLLEAGRLTELANHLMPIDAEPGLRHLLRPHTYQRFSRDAALAGLVHELEKHVDAPTPVSSYSLANRTRRAVALSPCCLNSQLGKVFFPYLDSKLFDFLGSLGAEMFLDHDFHTEAIRRAYPR